jgi:hypothetical protein
VWCTEDHKIDWLLFVCGYDTFQIDLFSNQRDASRQPTQYTTTTTTTTTKSHQISHYTQVWWIFKWNILSLFSSSYLYIGMFTYAKLASPVVTIPPNDIVNHFNYFKECTFVSKFVTDRQRWVLFGLLQIPNVLNVFTFSATAHEKSWYSISLKCFIITRNPSEKIICPSASVFG